MTDIYVDFHVRSAFSFLEGSSLPEDLVQRAADLGRSEPKRIWERKSQVRMETAIHCWSRIAQVIRTYAGLLLP